MIQVEEEPIEQIFTNVAYDGLATTVTTPSFADLVGNEYPLRKLTSPTLDEAFGLAYSQMELFRKSPHYNQTLLRLFLLPGTCEPEIIDAKMLNDRYGMTLQSCYLFKLKNAHPNGYTHGIYT